MEREIASRGNVQCQGQRCPLGLGGSEYNLKDAQRESGGTRGERGASSRPQLGGTGLLSCLDKATYCHYSRFQISKSDLSYSK